MRITVVRTLLMLAVGLIAATVGARAVPEGPVLNRGRVPSAAHAGAQPRDAASVLREMRAALGGEAALDAIKSFTVRGSIKQTAGGFTKQLSIDLSVLLPDHFLDVRRDWNSAGPMPVDITYYRGFRGDTLIRRTDSTMPFPPDPWPQTPAVIAQREREMTLRNKEDFARLVLILFGRSFSGYVLQFAYLGAEQREGRTIEVLEATGTDRYRMRLSVDAATHLPAMIEYLAGQGVMVSTSSRVAVRGNEVVSQTPVSPPAPVDTTGLPMVEHRLVPSNFKVQGGLNWPHRLTVTVGADVVSQMDLGAFRLNPKLDARRFDIGR